LNILRVHNYSVNFKVDKTTKFTAVNNINFTINSGEILGLIGESGSGKSVASKSITRLIQSAELTGNVFFNNHETEIDLLTCSTNELTRIRKNDIAYIFQEPMTALNPLIKCGKQILEGASNDSDNFLKEILLKVELDDFKRIASSYPHELSGGQRQRVMIAMALAKQPKLLIADEPTTALDVSVQGEILNLLRNLSRTESMAILFITHDLLSLKGFADNIAVMYKGELVEFDTATNVLEQPAHAYTKALIESRATYQKKGYKLSEIDHLIESTKDGMKSKKATILPLEKENITDESIIEVKDLHKSHFKKLIFKKLETKVLHDISFKLCQGDSLGLIGESGSGKSTIAKILLTIWSETEGNVLVYNKPIKSIQNLASKIQLVFQDPFSSLNPKHKIGNAISEVVKSTGTSNSKVQTLELLEEVGLQRSDYDKYPHEFSGGQRQRICIAKALAKNPKIIVLDEAVSALDVSVQAKILNLLNKLKIEKNLTYLLISHDMNVVSYFCNKIIVLKGGYIVEGGDTDDIIAKPSSNYTKKLLEHSIN
jgi:peptide/nickel transport system ATP-binding protein